MSQAERTFNEIADRLCRSDEVARGNMFGAKCLKIGKKAFAMFHKDDMVFKLNANDGELSGLDGAQTFEPAPGRPMNGWIRVPNRHSERWDKLSEEALNYVRQLGE